jgi:hypothetical protein
MKGEVVFLALFLVMLSKIHSFLPRHLVFNSRNWRRIHRVQFSAESRTDLERNPIFHSQIQFKDLCQAPALVEILESNRFINATDIQAKCFAEIVQGNDVIVGAETGSGKTLAYFLPVLDKLMATEKKLDTNSTEGAVDDSIVRKSYRGVILAPSTELCNQIVRMTQFLVDAANQTENTKVSLGIIISLVYSGVLFDLYLLYFSSFYSNRSKRREMSFVGKTKPFPEYQ